MDVPQISGLINHVPDKKFNLDMFLGASSFSIVTHGANECGRYYRRHCIGEDKSVGFVNLDIKLRTRALVNKDIH